MTTYILRRILQAIPLLFLISIVIFFLIRLVGDPFAGQQLDQGVSAEDIAFRRRSAGWDDPIWMQFIHWYFGDDWYQRDLDFDGEPDTYGRREGILRGDFGRSLRRGEPVTDTIQRFLPWTILLGTTALLTTVTFGLVIGLIAALKPYSWFDNMVTTGAFITFSTPIFLVALLSVYLFSIKFKEWGLPYLPTGGTSSWRSGSATTQDIILRLILPTLSLAAIQIAAYSRFIRASMLEALNSDYIRTAYAKGLKRPRIVLLHAFKNASFPLITLVALDIPVFLSGAVVTETIFSWPGMGRLFIDSLNNLDPPILLAFVLFVAVTVVVSQLLADILYAWIDPRVRY
jgi:peptide/nickel transport system permease protein